jgi:fructoselysine/glucoselysine PTS system EIIA component
MRKIILASHAKFAEGIKSTLEMIMGMQENVFVFCAYTEEQVDFKAKIKEIIESKDNEDEIVICTDMFGGSVNNELMEFTKIQGVYLVSGINVLFLIQLTISVTSVPTVDVIRDCIEQAKMGFIFCNDLDLDFK